MSTLFALRKHTASFSPIHCFIPSTRTNSIPSLQRDDDVHDHRALTNRISTNSRNTKRSPQVSPSASADSPPELRCKCNAVLLRLQSSAARAEGVLVENLMAVVACLELFLQSNSSINKQPLSWDRQERGQRVDLQCPRCEWSRECVGSKLAVFLTRLRLFLIPHHLSWTFLDFASGRRRDIASHLPVDTR